ncbi:MAG: PP0621 family protein [Gallionellaceae bacterium]|nr:PP0621 family protein [Gallionellaceae bacterium]
MSRLIFIIVVIALVWWVLKSYRKQSNNSEASKPAEEMVRCKLCGVHLPKSESIFSEGEYFCCDAHRRERADRKE